MLSVKVHALACGAARARALYIKADPLTAGSLSVLIGAVFLVLHMADSLTVSNSATCFTYSGCDARPW